MCQSARAAVGPPRRRTSMPRGRGDGGTWGRQTCLTTLIAEFCDSAERVRCPGSGGKLIGINDTVWRGPYFFACRPRQIDIKMNYCHPSFCSRRSFRASRPGASSWPQGGGTTHGPRQCLRGPRVLGPRPASSALTGLISMTVIRGERIRVKARFTTNQALWALVGAVRAIWVARESGRGKIGDPTP